MIRATCPACQFARDFDDHLASWEVNCRECRHPFTVGAPAPESQLEPAGVASRVGSGLARFVFGVVGGLLLIAACAAFIGFMATGRVLLEGANGHPAWKHPIAWLIFAGCGVACGAAIGLVALLCKLANATLPSVQADGK